MTTDIADTTYDAIGRRFESFTATAAQRDVEVRTVLDMVGDVRAQTVLDLACGYGFFGRTLMSRGAARVVGVDISTKMIGLARAESEKHRDSIEFHVRNVCEMESLGEFDVIVAAWLFNYAETLDDLGKMFIAAARNLKPTGRLIAYTVDPDFRLDRGNFTQYGVDVRTEQPWFGGMRHCAAFATQPPSPFVFFRWGRNHYEQAAAGAGFNALHWHKPRLLEADVIRYPPGFWDVFQENCLQIGLICHR